MDWLTEEWKQETWLGADAAWQKYGEKQGRFTHGKFVADYIARAAARKVVEWVEEHSTVEDDNPNCRLVLLGRTHVRCIREESDWQALRQEVQ